VAANMCFILAEAYFHRLDPFALRFPDGFWVPGIRWYGLSYMAGFLVGWLLIRWLARSGRSNLPPEAVGDFLFYLIAGTIVGGRLGYCIFYQPSLFWPPWGVLMVWKGGMASHGGFIGVILGGILFARRQGVSKLHLIDIAAFACPPGLGFGRLANFVNAELWGKALPPRMQTDPPWWSVKYPDEILAARFPHPTELEKLREMVPEGGEFRRQLVDAAVSGDQQVIDALRPLLTAYYPSQIFQALSEGVVLFAVLGVIWLWPRRPGVIGGSFLISYGIMRIATEIFRQPDEGVALLPTPFGDLSRGQVLSVLMVVCGIFMAGICARRRQAPPQGGLLWPASPPPTDSSTDSSGGTPIEGEERADKPANGQRSSGKAGRKRRKRKR
jgi:phosphatidylglycerol:prolipoprotein diacylglycerol transferase